MLPRVQALIVPEGVNRELARRQQHPHGRDRGGYREWVTTYARAAITCGRVAEARRQAKSDRQVTRETSSLDRAF